ncbi:thiamine phosphate synthase [Magnetococcales bacterium HHB-1]
MDTSPPHIKNPPPNLLLISTADERCSSAFEVALEEGVKYFLLRKKQWETRAFYNLGQRMTEYTQKYGAHFLIHNRIDIALALNADGVHLSENGLPVHTARQLLGPHLLLGKSCHQIKCAKKAFEQGADYVTLSPLFPTRSHPGANTLGVELFKQMCAIIPGPVLALGGISAHNVSAAIEAGASGVALIRGILHASNPREAARQLLYALGEETKTP